MTASASHAAGRSEAVAVPVSLAAGTHTVTVNFLNDAYGGSPGMDRNLYIDRATINGQAIAGGTLSEQGQGPQSFLLTIPGSTPSAPAPTPTPTPTSTPAPNTSAAAGLVLDVSEDAWQGDAQYTIQVDGQQVGGTMTASASHAAGRSEAVAVPVSLAAGTHTVTVNFLNDAYGGSPGMDRNLYIDRATINGQAIAGGTLSEQGQGPQSFLLTIPGSTPTPAPTPTPTPTSTPAPNTSAAAGLVLDVSEDAWQGDAQYTIQVDGQQVGGTMTASASHAAGRSEAVAVPVSLAAGTHTVTVNFLNDAYGGSPGMDRNLYIDRATINGQAIAGGTLSEQGQGPQSFLLTIPGSTPTPAPTPTDSDSDSDTHANSDIHAHDRSSNGPAGRRIDTKQLPSRQSAKRRFVVDPSERNQRGTTEDNTGCRYKREDCLESGRWRALLHHCRRGSCFQRW